ncbi:tetratricopeptide repeat protein [Streptomyces sp. NPDC059009]|uniref:tetratricopeptide repeat protein n=1 Tax=Streptomyces sp. NPDC059009 TaxID=3346694 RepID=UPI003696EDF5
MTSSADAAAPRHHWAAPAPLDAYAATSNGALPQPPRPHLEVPCHRRLRGPYTGAGRLLRRVVPELVERHPELVAERAPSITAVAPDLTPLVPAPPQTLTNQADRKERTRFYPATRAPRLAHGVTELLLDWARVLHPDGVVVAFRDLDAADPTDRDLVDILLRRADPAVLTVVADSSGTADDALGRRLRTHTARSAGLPRPAPEPPRSGDLAQLFIDTDGTSAEPALLEAYAALSPGERARRHTARAAELAALDEPGVRLGAIPYHLEHGSDPQGAGVDALREALNLSFAMGFYEAVVDLAQRGRRLAPSTERPDPYWHFTHRLAACLCYLGRGHDAIGYLQEIRRGSLTTDLHMGAAYLLAMLYTRFLPKEDHDEDIALAWVNTAICIADAHPNPGRRILVRSFMRNARALVELHRANPEGALALVNEAMALTDADFAPHEQLLHRSVLLYNRAQVLGAGGDHLASLIDYDEVIRRDPDYGDYYFERAAQHRALGHHPEALTDYATAIRLTPPFHEAHFNRADLLRELGEDDAALRDLDYALEVEPDHMESLISRADLYMERGETERARADIDRGLGLDPDNAPLLAARGALLADSGDTEAAYESYTAALRRAPTYVAAWANRAVLAYTTGRPVQAVGDLSEALRLTEDGDDTALRANRAIALQDIGDHARAVEDLDRALAGSDGTDPDLLYRRGVSRHALADIEGALADWRAHLAAFGPGEMSPHAEEIRARAGDLVAAVRGEGAA